MPNASITLPSLDVTLRRETLAWKVSKGLMWATSAKVMGMVAGLVVNALLARRLSTEAMGSYFLVMAVVTLVALFARGGTPQALVKLMAESMSRGQPGRARRAVRHALVVTVVGALLGAVATYLAIGPWAATHLFNDSRIAGVCGLMALWVIVMTLGAPVANAFRGLHDIRVSMYLQLASTKIFLAILLLVFWLTGYSLDLHSAVALSLLAALGTLVVGGILLVRKMQPVHGAGDVPLAEVISLSTPLLMLNLANYALTEFSLWVAGATLQSEDVAMYGAALRLVNLVYLPLLLVGSAVQPVIADLYRDKKDNAHLEQVLRGAATLAGMPSALVLLVFAIFGGQIVTLVYGEPYAGAHLPLVILALGHLVNVWTGSCSQVLAMTGHQREAMWQALGWAAVTIVAGIVGAKLGGLIGLSVAVAAGLALTNLTKWWMVHHYTGLWTHAVLNPADLREGARAVLNGRRRGRKNRGVL
ncbi:MAG: lipopolysaccharide biosynthesis protein [Panacagrimonas sp.]